MIKVDGDRLLLVSGAAEAIYWLSFDGVVEDIVALNAGDVVYPATDDDFVYWVSVAPAGAEFVVRRAEK